MKRLLIPLSLFAGIVLFAISALIFSRTKAVREAAETMSSQQSRPRAGSSLPDRARQTPLLYRGDLTTRTPEELRGDIVKGLQSGDQSAMNLVVEDFLPALMQRDLALAISLAEELPEWAWREEVLTLVANEFATEDPAAAFQWAEKLEPEAHRQAALTQALVVGVELDAKETLQLSSAMEEEMLATIVPRLIPIAFGEEPEFTLKWIEEELPSDLRPEAYHQAVLFLAADEPGRATTLALEKLSGSELQQDAILSIVSQWVRKEPEALQRWVGDFPEGELKERALSEVAGYLRYQEQDEAEETSIETNSSQ